MKTILLSSILLCSVLLSKAQTTQNRDIKPFKQIEISGTASVIYIQSDTLSLKIEAHENEFANIITIQEGDALIIKTSGKFKDCYKIIVGNNQLKSILSTGSSKLTSDNTINADSLAINISGASTINLKIKANNLNIIESGASLVTLEGTTKELSTVISGASTLKSYKLTSDNAIVSASGASIVKVFVVNKISANATGSSTIKFKGDPKDVSAEASISSTVAKVLDNDNAKKSDSKNDSTSISFGKKKLVIIDKESDSDDDEKTKKVDDDDFHHWGGFGLGVNGWLSNGNTSLPKNQNYMALNYGKSLNFQLNFEKDIHLYKNYINLVTGLGFEWSQYQFDNKTRLNPDTNYTFGVIDTTNTFSYKKNKLKTTFINVPLLVEFNTNKNPDKAFHIALGVIGGYKLGSRTRQVLEQNGNTIRFIRKDDYNINPFRLSAHASIGYKNFTMFGTYALNELFVNGKGPQLQAFTIGLKIISF